MEKTILIVEDDERIRHLICDYFKKEKFKILEADNGFKAIDMFKTYPVDLIILDIMLPYMDGWTVCKNVRTTSTVPIIILTAKSQEDDKLLGYELGADDYITKPFSPKVLVAKAKAIIKRVNSISTASTDTNDYVPVEIDGVTINELSHYVTIDGKEITLSPKEYELLLYFVKNRGILLTRDKILDSIWGYDYYGDLRTVDTNVKRLREKLGDKAYLIATVRGSGYKFEVKK